MLLYARYRAVSLIWRKKIHKNTKSNQNWEKKEYIIEMEIIQVLQIKNSIFSHKLIYFYIVSIKWWVLSYFYNKIIFLGFERFWFKEILKIDGIQEQTFDESVGYILSDCRRLNFLTNSLITMEIIGICYWNVFRESTVLAHDLETGLN